MNLYRHLWWIFCEYLRLQNYSKYIPTSILSIFLCLLLSQVHKLIFRMILFIELSTLIIPLHSIIWKSSISQFKSIFKRNELFRSQIFLLITSTSQSISHQSLQMIFKSNEKSYSIFLSHDILSSTTTFSKNMIYLSMKFSMMQFN